MQNPILHLSKILALAALSFGFFACGGSASDNPAVISGSSEVSRLEIIDTDIGTGATAVTGHSITVHYEGWLYDINAPDLHGGQFDSTLGGDPYTFSLGSGEVISGWDQGLMGMKVGGRRTLIVPSGLAYGRGGFGKIPPNAALVFDVELVDVD